MSAIAAQAQSVMTHHVRDAVKHGQANGHLPQGQLLNLDLVLPLRDPAGLDAFLEQLNDPTSAGYRQYLTPQQFTERFGSSQSDYDAVVQWAKTHGMNVTGGSRGGSDVQVQGSVGAIESAFHVHMNTYKHPKENRNFYSADAEPTTDLAFSLWHVSGLDNFSIPQPLMVNKDEYAAAHGISPDQVVSHATTGSGPSASFLGSDMRAAYYGSGSLDGSGQTIGLLEYYGTDLVDLQNYYTNVHQTYPGSQVTLLSTDGTSTSCVYSGLRRCDDGEQNLDMTQAFGMAPKANVVMYVGSSDTAIMSSLTTHTPLAMTIGCSWGWTPADPSTLDPYFKKMQAQGQTFLAASGDYSTWKSSGNSAAWPADDAYVVSVGGTDLITTGAGGAWQSETAWADSGGGISPDGIALPSWQNNSAVLTSTNGASSTYRNGPDVSANANFTFYTCGDQQACQANYYGGTSFAAPMWAGYLALVNQQLAAKSQSPVGFINPTIYPQNQTSAYATNFHDVTSGTSGSYSAVAGFDLVTGWGSPTPALVNALTGGSTQPQADFSVSASNATVTAGSNGTSTITVTGTGGYSGMVSFSASGLPSGVSFGAGTVTGSGSTMGTFTTTSSATPGTYTVTITGTDGSNVSHSTTLQLTVNAAQQTGTFTLMANPTSTTVVRGSTSVPITIQATANNGFNSSISLSASGATGGVTVSFGSSSIAANGNTTMTIKVNKNVQPGTRTITVTGTGGGQTASTTVTLTTTR